MAIDNDDMEAKLRAKMQERRGAVVFAMDEVTGFVSRRRDRAHANTKIKTRFIVEVHKVELVNRTR